MIHPFFILGTPRSRTAWLASFLSQPGRPCLHEPTPHLGSREEFLAMLRDPAAAISDSGLTLAWQDVVAAAPTARVVVVRRSHHGVLESFSRLGMNAAELEWMSVVLRQIEEDISLLCLSHPVLMVPYHALDQREVCRAIYEFCLGRSMLAGWWEDWAPRNVQADYGATLAQVRRNMPAILSMIPALAMGAH